MSQEDDGAIEPPATPRRNAYVASTDAALAEIEAQLEQAVEQVQAVLNRALDALEPLGDQSVSVSVTREGLRLKVTASTVVKIGDEFVRLQVIA